MLSLQKAGFDVIVWSLEPLKLPAGIKNGDANEIVPKDFLDKYTQSHHSDKNYPAEKANLALYSDVFRAKVLQKHGGWWFDLDVFCTKPVSWYDEMYEKLPVVIGVEIVPSLLNWAIFAMPSKEHLDNLCRYIDAILSIKKVFAWGELGPSLVTGFLQQVGLFDKALHWTVFYAANYRYEGLWDDDPVQVALLETVCRTSAAIHWYNNVMHVMADGGQGILPNSYMGKLFATLPQKELLKYPVSSKKVKK